MSFASKEINVDSIGSGYEETIQQLEQIINVESPELRLPMITDVLGFDNYFMCVCSPTSLTCFNVLVNTTQADEWATKYKKNKLYLVDPMLHYAISNSTPIRWDELIELDLYKKEHYQDFFKLINANGQLSGVSFSFKSPAGDYVLLSFSSNRTSEQTDKELKKALVLVPWLRTCILGQSETMKTQQPDGDNDFKLTKREKQCLFWACEGKTAWEISKIIEVSVSTANFHLKNSMEKLSASNRQHAVAKALMYGIVKPDLPVQ